MRVVWRLFAVGFGIFVMTTGFGTAAFAAETWRCAFEKCYSFGDCSDEVLRVTASWDETTGKAQIETPGPRPFEADAVFDAITRSWTLVSREGTGAVYMMTIFDNGKALFTSHAALGVDPKPFWISGAGECKAG